MDYVYYKKMSIDIFFFLKNSFAKSHHTNNPRTSIRICIKLFTSNLGWHVLIIKLVAYTLIYGIVMFWLFMNMFEKELLFLQSVKS
jgi:hypothetical protein